MLERQTREKKQSKTTKKTLSSLQRGRNPDAQQKREPEEMERRLLMGGGAFICPLAGCRMCRGEETDRKLLTSVRWDLKLRVEMYNDVCS